jgi:hypothetical protein
MADIQIVSRAMNLLGRQSITSIQDDDWGPIINAQAESANRIILEKFKWNFSRKFLLLQPKTTNSNPRWNLEYQLPTDFINRVDLLTSFDDNGTIKVGQSIPYDEYEITDNLYTNREDIILFYTATSEETATRSATYIEALAYKIASELAPILLNNASMAQYYNEKHMYYLEEARNVDFGITALQDNWFIEQRSI